MAINTTFARVSVLAVLLATGAMAIVWLAPNADNEPEYRDAVAAPAQSDARAVSSPVPAEPELTGRKLLRNVDINGSVDLNPDGSLAYSLALRDLFDHFLSMAGSSDQLGAARAALEAHLEARGLVAAVTADVLAAFGLYVEYLAQAESVALDAYEADDMAYTFARLAELRRSVLGRDLAEAFFGADEARETYLTEQRRVVTDASLSAQARSERLADLEQALPKDMQLARRQATAVIRLRDETRALRSAGASDEVIHYLREEQVGPEAADRLRQLDEQRSDWERRLNRYHQEREAVAGSAGLADHDREQLLADLRARYFSGSEVRRVKALDRLAAAEPHGDN